MSYRHEKTPDGVRNSAFSGIGANRYSNGQGKSAETRAIDRRMEQRANDMDAAAMRARQITATAMRAGWVEIDPLVFLMPDGTKIEIRVGD